MGQLRPLDNLPDKMTGRFGLNNRPLEEPDKAYIRGNCYYDMLDAMDDERGARTEIESNVRKAFDEATTPRGKSVSRQSLPRGRPATKRPLLDKSSEETAEEYPERPR